MLGFPWPRKPLLHERKAQIAPIDGDKGNRAPRVFVYSCHGERRSVEELAKLAHRSLRADLFPWAVGASVWRIDICDTDVFSVIAPTMDYETIAARDLDRDRFTSRVLAIGCLNTERNIGSQRFSVDGHSRQ
jgi:hypothetical protein